MRQAAETAAGITRHLGDSALAEIGCDRSALRGREHDRAESRNRDKSAWLLALRSYWSRDRRCGPRSLCSLRSARRPAQHDRLIALLSNRPAKAAQRLLSGHHRLLAEVGSNRPSGACGSLPLKARRGGLQPAAPVLHAVPALRVHPTSIGEPGGCSAAHPAVHPRPCGLGAEERGSRAFAEPCF